MYKWKDKLNDKRIEKKVLTDPFNTFGLINVLNNRLIVPSKSWSKQYFDETHINFSGFSDTFSWDTDDSDIQIHHSDTFSEKSSLKKRIKHGAKMVEPPTSLKLLVTIMIRHSLLISYFAINVLFFTGIVPVMFPDFPLLTMIFVPLVTVCIFMLFPIGDKCFQFLCQCFTNCIFDAWFNKYMTTKIQKAQQTMKKQVTLRSISLSKLEDDTVSF